MITDKSLKKLLNDFKKNKITEKDFFKKIKNIAFISLKESKIDTHRSLRKSLPELILGKGKSIQQLRNIINKMIEHNEKLILVTKLTKEKAMVLQKEFKCEYSAEARILKIGKYKKRNNRKKIGIITAGTSDIPIAMEAKIILEILGYNIITNYDCGVAGIHRLFPFIEKLKNVKCVIVIAGMEGALPSVVAGLIDKPIIAVPTSIGYGANFKGLSALLGMLNSCSFGISVVNIDNGIGAGYFAHLISKEK